ncbi:MAG: metal ABC transporter permease [Ignavibacteria bacterium]|nr:metal ABC transporter permease [Ignavibacteria bacterium]
MTEFIKYFLLEPLQYEFIQRALLASVAVGISCGLIGVYIMLRRMSLIGDALAHAVLPGIVIGFMVAGKSELVMFTGAVVSGIITSVLIGFLSRNSIIKEDTSIGIIFTGAFALGILLISQLKGVHLDLSSYLFGDILGVSTGDLILSFTITLVIIICVILFYKQLLITSFDPTLAITIGIPVSVIHYGLMTLLSMSIVAGLQSVGVVLLVAMLITPAATAYLLTHSLKKILPLSVLIAVVASISGLFLSYHFNFSSGASIVLTAVMFFTVAFIFSPKEGLLIKYLRKKKTARTAISEDVIKLIMRYKGLQLDEQVSKLSSETGLHLRNLKSILNSLESKGFLYSDNNSYSLTNQGLAEARRLVRTHRLWETYASKEKFLSDDELHSDAEKIEHLLPDELVDELDRELGYPEKDPHGSEIPRTES